MAVVFGTLGYRPKSLIPTIRTTPEVEKVVFYCGADKSEPEAARRVAEARAAVLEFCKSMRIPAHAVDLEDPFDFKSTAIKIRDDIRRHKVQGHKVAVFNIAGGTRPTSSAALLACILEGIPTVYVHDVTFEEIRLPLLRMEYNQVLSKEEREVMRYLMGNRSKDVTEVELATALKKHKATMNYHIRKLVSKGAVRLEPHPKDSRKKLVRVEESIELLLGEDQ